MGLDVTQPEGASVHCVVDRGAAETRHQPQAPRPNPFVAIGLAD